MEKNFIVRKRIKITMRVFDEKRERNCKRSTGRIFALVEFRKITESSRLAGWRETWSYWPFITRFLPACRILFFTRIDSHFPRNSLKNRRVVGDFPSFTIVFRDSPWDFRRWNFALPNERARNLKRLRFFKTLYLIPSGFSYICRLARYSTAL